MKIFYSCIKYTGIIIMLFGSVHMSAQGGQYREKIMDKLKAQRVAYITEQLELSESEAQKFWPIYNSYTAETDQLKASLDVKPSKNMTDKEAEDMMYMLLDGRIKEVEIQKKYIQKLKTAIPPRKIVLLFRAEREFKEKVISNFKERRKERLKD